MESGNGITETEYGIRERRFQAIDLGKKAIKAQLPVHQYSISIQLGEEVELISKTPATSRVGHVLSIQFRDNHVVWSEAKYYFS